MNSRPAVALDVATLVHPGVGVALAVAVDEVGRRPDVDFGVLLGRTQRQQRHQCRENLHRTALILLWYNPSRHSSDFIQHHMQQPLTDFRCSLVRRGRMNKVINVTTALKSYATTALRSYASTRLRSYDFPLLN